MLAYYGGCGVVFGLGFIFVVCIFIANSRKGNAHQKIIRVLSVPTQDRLKIQFLLALLAFRRYSTVSIKFSTKSSQMQFCSGKR
jgi:hypothetical protein